MNKTTIKISRDVKSQLDSLKTGNDTYNDVIERILELLDISNEIGLELYDENFKINCEVDFEDEHFYFLDDLGNRSEFLKATASFVDDNVQKQYEEFLSEINEVAQGDLNLLDYAAELDINETVELDGFNMKRTY
jgi:predicted CopG family antitoxin